MRGDGLCKNGHVLAVVGYRGESCLICRRIYMREYGKKWRKTEKGIATQHRYSANNPEISIRLPRAEFEKLERLVGFRGISAALKKLMREFLKQAKERAA